MLTALVFLPAVLHTAPWADEGSARPGLPIPVFDKPARAAA